MIFKGLLESAPDAMVITNGAGRILMVNAQTEAIFGYSRHEIIGEEIEIQIPDRFHSNHVHHRENYVHNPKVRSMGVGMALFGKRRNGEEFPVEVSLSPMTLDDGELLVMSAIRDTTEQKRIEAEIKAINENLESLVQERTKELEGLSRELQEMNTGLEQRVTRRTMELEAINKELEAFSYSVSHDLRAPLRSIDGFSNKILKDYGDRFDDQAKDYFNRIMNASRKMGTLIDDLLHLARLTRIEMRIETANMSEMAEAIVRELKESAPQRQAEINIRENMVVAADRNLMQIALQNLLGNAWKYSKNQELTKIEFAFYNENGRTIYYIKDNGVGFDMKYADKLFVAFQRLHSVAEFEGTGIGLATVQRIIRRHHGNIWAKSQPGQGTTFYFTLN
jgi:PAS domain S-box-containing protein